MCGRVRLLARDRQVRACSRPRRSCSPPAASARRGRSRRTPGSTPATARAGLRGRRRPDRHGVRPVPPDRDGLAAQRARHPGDRGRARRRRDAEEHRRASASCSTTSPSSSRAETADTEEEADALVRGQEEQPPHAGPAAARRGGARDQRRGQGRARGSPHGGVFLDISTRRVGRLHPEAPAVDVPPVQGAGGRRHHEGADGGRADLPLHDGRRARRRRDHGGDRARPVRRRRGAPAACTARTASAATRSPTCWCSAGGPGSHAAEYAQAPRAAADRRRAAGRRRRARRCSTPFERDRRREPVRDPRRPPGDACRAWSASSGPRPS